MITYKPLTPFHRQNYPQLRGLIDLILHLPTCLTWAEIGCYDGSSAELFMLKCSKIYCIDRWDWTPEFYDIETPKQVEDRFDDRMSVYGNHVVKIKGRSEEVFDKIPDRSLDGIYIDGFHSEEQVRKDYTLYEPKLKDNSYVTGHDYLNPDTPGVTSAVQKMFGEPDIYFIDYSWMVKFDRSKL